MDIQEVTDDVLTFAQALEAGIGLPVKISLVERMFPLPHNERDLRRLSPRTLAVGQRKCNIRPLQGKSRRRIIRLSMIL